VRALSIRSVSIVRKKSYPEISEIERNFQISDDGEVCLAIGGDGTFLRAAKRFDRPILHIRGGEKDSLGFHADVTLSEIREVIEDLKQRRYLVDRYPKLRVTHQGRSYDAVNDAVLFRAGSRAIHFRVDYYDHEGNELPLYPEVVRGDGVIFTGQMGSTAYNYFAHGPILFDLDAVVVTPISANYTFSIVSDRDFHVKVLKNVGILECDGVNVTKLYGGDSFTVTRSDRVVKVVRLKRRENFSDKLARLERF